MQCLHRDVVGHHKVVEANILTDDPHDLSGQGRGGIIQRVIDQMRGHPHRQIPQAAEGRKIDRLQINPAGIDTGQIVVAVERGAAMTGHMFHHRQHAPGQQCIGHGAANLGHLPRRLAIAAVAQEGMGFGRCHIDQRRAVAIDSDAVQFMGDDPVHEIERSTCLIPGACSKVHRRHPIAPLRGTHALHAAALLVDGDHRVMARRLSYLLTKRANLVGAVDVARKKNEAKGPHVPEERLFLDAEPMARGVEDRGPEGAHQRITTGIQSAFSATRAEQKRRASAISSKPMARRR